MACLAADTDPDPAACWPERPRTVNFRFGRVLLVAFKTGLSFQGHLEARLLLFPQENIAPLRAPKELESSINAHSVA